MRYDWDDGEFTAGDIPRLDQLHEKIGMSEEWLNSERRADILSRGSETEEVSAPDDRLQQLIEGLWTHLGREPTVKEVHNYIYGTDEDRAYIWNSIEQDELPREVKRVRQVSHRYHRS